ncbi:MAG: phosphoenolpyruvate hydrolase family protein [Lachnospiraceae bacterium]|nr:phosphoenolpyruvate hydrolase family protein [Lachnospiraceae bacterium]
MDREQILKKLRATIHINGHITGVAAGGGMTAKYAAMGGTDLILALSAGKFRQMGRSSLASFLCYGNSNEVVMDFATKELLPSIKDVPIIFGLNGTDPTIHLYEYLQNLKQLGFAGINNFPSVGMIDGKFREELEERGGGYEREIEAVRLAHFLDLFTVAFVFDGEQARKMAEAGADVICAHFGLTSGGMLGAKKVLTLEYASKAAQEMFDAAGKVREDVIRMVYGGPIRTPIDASYIYEHTSCEGYIGGSSFERIPIERAILNTARAFKTPGSFDPDDIMVKMLTGLGKHYDYVEFVTAYIEDHYGEEIQLNELALVAHVSTSYLSTKFKKEKGISFSEYLVRFRMDKAAEIMGHKKLPMTEIAAMVGYQDYAQFSKMFKKYKGNAPTRYYYMKYEEKKERG